MNLSNKHKRNKTGEWIKHPGVFLKKLTNSRLRKDPIIIEDDIVSYKSKKKNIEIRKKRNCPFCLDDIYMQYKNEEKKLLRLCKKCGAVKTVLKTCPHCKYDKVWQKDNVFICKHCGKQL